MEKTKQLEKKYEEKKSISPIRHRKIFVVMGGRLQKRKIIKKK